MQKKDLVLYVITHTETYFNRNRIFTGQRDSKLTPLGHRQAEALAKKLKNKQLGLVFLSPLKRAHETFEHIKKYHPGIKVIIDKRFIERDYGDLSGKSKVKYREVHPGFYNVYHRSYETPPPHGESMKSVEKRVLDGLQDVIKHMRQKDVNVLIVAHNNSVRPIRRHFEKMTPQEMMDVDNYRKIFAYKIKI